MTEHPGTASPFNGGSRRDALRPVDEASSASNLSRHLDVPERKSGERFAEGLDPPAYPLPEREGGADSTSGQSRTIALT